MSLRDYIAKRLDFLAEEEAKVLRQSVESNRKVMFDLSRYCVELERQNKLLEEERDELLWKFELAIG